MADLTPQERLQPSLLDRLTDDEPDKSQESRDLRVLSWRRIRQCVLRDIAWLLNDGNLETSEDLDDYPLVKQSVLNYGMPDLTGATVSGTDIASLERALKQVIMTFEPRILPNSLRIRVNANETEMNHNAMTFEIEGDLWAQPTPQRLFMKTTVDLELGAIEVRDMGG